MYTESTPAIADTRRPHAGTLSQASLMHQSDDRLVTLARSGSERAWSEITRRYRRQLRSYCGRFVGPSRAEDAVQQTFLQAFLALRDGAQRDIALRAWLYRIAHNCSIDLLRKGTPEYEQLDLEYDGVPQPPTLFEQREEVRRLVARMRDLPAAQRQALALRELEGRSYEEISAQLGHSGSGVRQLIFRARTTLRNGAAAVLPLGLLKGRVQSVPLECHHVATAVSVPASSGGGLDAVGAATLAVVAVLGGGLATADGGPRRARPASLEQSGASPSPPVPVAGQLEPARVAAPHARLGRALSASPATGGADDDMASVAPPITASPAPVVPVPPTSLPPVAVTPAEPAPAALPMPEDTMRQQAFVTTPADASGTAGVATGAGSTAAPATTPTSAPSRGAATAPPATGPAAGNTNG
jgi:RNA polymerase sigma factor (sigma-70 family)